MSIIMTSKLSAIGISLLLIFSIFAVAPVSAQESESDEPIPEEHTKYIIDHNTETGESTVQVEVRLSETSKFADWNLSWNIPESSTITEVRTKSSESVDFERDGSSVNFSEDDGPARNSETFYITYETSELISTTDRYSAHRNEVSLSGLPEADSYVEITFDEEIANAVRFSDHSLKVEEKTFTASGSGPPSFFINTMDESPVIETDDYAVYGEELPKETLDNSYAISTIATGVIPQYNQVPLVVLSEEDYDDRFNTVSEGQFNGGIIYLSEEVTTERRLLPMLTHEYTHAVTQRMEPTSPSRWFTEGASQYTESIALDKVGRPQNEIDIDRYRDYQSNEDKWVSNSEWITFNNEQQKFAYSYSELLFKNKEMQTDDKYVHQLYRDMNTDSLTIDQDTQPNVLYGDDWDGTICEGPESETRDCVVEKMDYIPNLEQPDEFVTPFEEEPETQNITYEQTEYDSEGGSIESDSESGDSPLQILDKIIDAIERFLDSEFIQNILEAINNILGNTR